MLLFTANSFINQEEYLIMQKLNLSDLQKVANTSYYKKSQLARMNKASLYELLEKHNRNICNIEHITKLDMIDCLLEINNS